MKVNRHQKIRELIKAYPINTQEELLEKLSAEGYSVTQSTVSRDIKSLRLQKSLSVDGKYRYIAPEVQSDKKAGFEGILSGSVISAEVALNIVVVKTYAGMASAACAAIDSMHFNGVVGSLAGDDTIFIACTNNTTAEEFVEALNKLL
ncbi:MAG: arginine repressor [Ruminococcaceae bacterium]|nr:arginine repressor [Oscillospiraceae bacterium]